MAETISKPSAVEVQAFLAAVPSGMRRDDGFALDQLFREITGFAPRMWGSSIVGYGRYAYRYASGHSGNAPATGFSPRKATFVIYLLAGYENASGQLSRLGKYKIGKSCLYINRLADVDMAVLAEIIRDGLAELATRWEIAAD